MSTILISLQFLELLLWCPNLLEKEVNRYRDCVFIKEVLLIMAGGGV